MAIITNFSKSRSLDNSVMNNRQTELWDIPSFFKINHGSRLIFVTLPLFELV